MGTQSAEFSVVLRRKERLPSCAALLLYARRIDMRQLRFLLFSQISIMAIFALSCGTGSSSNTPRQLLSVTVSPATADAADYPSGQVPFTATGNYNSAPYTVTPLPGIWGACFNNASTTAISVTSEGVAQCAAGAVGTYTVWASAPEFPNGANCQALTACGGGCFVAGTAQLICPTTK